MSASPSLDDEIETDSPQKVRSDFNNFLRSLKTGQMTAEIHRMVQEFLDRSLQLVTDVTNDNIRLKTKFYIDDRLNIIDSRLEIIDESIDNPVIPLFEPLDDVLKLVQDFSSNPVLP